MKRTAEFSPSGLYRYQLTRTWNEEAPAIVFCMLNPSTADATHDDATIRRCISFATGWGFGGLVVVNLYALCATNPEDLADSFEAGIDPVGRENDEWIRKSCMRPEGGPGRAAIAAWGNGPSQLWRLEGEDGIRELVVEDQLRRFASGVDCLGRNRSGAPKHPLRLRATTPREAYFR